jgi:hypothetical protein
MVTGLNADPVGGPDLDFVSVPGDIIRPGKSLPGNNPKRSLRAYLSVLFVNPRLHLTLQGVKVGFFFFFFYTRSTGK